MNLFLAHIIFRTLSRLALASLAVPLIAVVIESVMAARAPEWSTALSWSLRLYPLASGWALADLWVELELTGERIGAESLGLNPLGLACASASPVVFWAFVVTGAGQGPMGEAFLGLVVGWLASRQVTGWVRGRSRRPARAAALVATAVAGLGVYTVWTLGHHWFLST